VFVAEPLDALLRHTGLEPDFVRLVVRLVDGDPQARLVETELVRRKLQRPGDDLGLEVVADAEVAQHLEEREVRGVPNGLDIADSKTLLYRYRARPGWIGLAHEIRFERHHACAREEQRRVIVGGDDGRAGHAAMASLLEEAQEGFAQFVWVHQSDYTGEREAEGKKKVVRVSSVILHLTSFA